MDQEETVIDCPFCGESIAILIDPSAARQTYIEDCSVCCRPIQLTVLCEDGSVVSVEEARS
jgi:hypothetical protein